MYYFGERVTYKDLTLIHKDNFIKRMQRDYLSRLGIDEAIFCENANRIIYNINPKDKTIDGLKLERLNEKSKLNFY